MRTRVDRGQLQVIKRDGTRRITEGELETAGLLGSSSDPEIVRLRSENAQLRQELQAMRTLPARVEAEREARDRMEQAFHQARAEKQAADQGAQAIQIQLEEIAAAGPIRGAPRVIVGKSRPVWPGFAGYSYPQWGLGSRARTADAPPGRAERSSTKPPRVARSPRPVPEVAAQSPGRPAVPPCSVQMPPSLLPFSGLTASSGRLHCLASAGANQPAQVWARGPSRARRRPNEPRNPGFHLRSSTESQIRALRLRRKMRGQTPTSA